MGRALAAGVARHGWDVLVGTRSPEDLAEWATGVNGTVAVGSFAAAAGHGDVAVLAVRGTAAEDVGDIESARYLETLVPLWVRFGSVLGTYDHAFRAVR